MLDVESVLGAVAVADVEQVNQHFSRLYDEQGVAGFITQTVVPLVHTIGEHWARGQLQAFEEHFVSQ